MQMMDDCVVERPIPKLTPETKCNAPTRGPRQGSAPLYLDPPAMAQCQCFFVSMRDTQERGSLFLFIHFIQAVRRDPGPRREIQNYSTRQTGSIQFIISSPAF